MSYVANDRAKRAVVPRPGIEPVFPYVAKRNHSRSTLVARNKQLRLLTFGFDLFSFALVSRHRKELNK